MPSFNLFDRKTTDADVCQNIHDLWASVILWRINLFSLHDYRQTLHPSIPQFHSVHLNKDWKL
jgi:hypothetical protein